MDDLKPVDGSASPRANDACAAEPAVLMRMPRFVADAMEALVLAKIPGVTVTRIRDATDALNSNHDHAESRPVVLWRHLPNEPGPVQAVELLVQAGLPIILIVDEYDARLIRMAMELGVRAIVPASLCAEAVVCIMELALAGGTYFPCRADWLRRDIDRSDASANRPELSHFTPRQLDVLACICRGDSNKAIARTLGMHECTVKAHVMALMRGLGVNNRTQVALRCASFAHELRGPERTASQSAASRSRPGLEHRTERSPVPMSGSV